MQVEHRFEGEIAHVVVRGDVDAASCGALASRLHQLAEEGHEQVVIEADGVDFLDSSGLRVLLAAEERCRAAGGALHLHRPSPAVRHVLELTDLGPRFGVDDR